MNRLLSHKNKFYFTIAILVLIGFQVAAQVNASFTPSATTGCAPLLVNFANQSAGSGNAYSWNFGDGNTSTQSAPVVSYTAAGTYTVTLTAAAGGHTSTSSTVITVFKAPQAQFAISDTLGCYPFAVSFTDQSVQGSSPIQTWQWLYGDGSPSSALKNNTHIYADSGVFSISLFITDKNGCDASAVMPKVMHVTGSPLAPAFTPSNSIFCAAPQSVSFTNNTPSIPNTSIAYSWNFGNGNTSNQANPAANNYTTSGNYAVTMTASIPGCVRTATAPISLISHSNINFSSVAPVQCGGDSVHFLNETQPLPTSLLWRFGDGDTSSMLNPVYRYNTGGLETVTLVVQYGPGCSDSLTKKNYIQIQSSALVAVTADTVRACQVPFKVTFSTSGLPLSSLSWNYGDKTPPSPSLTHTYNHAGIDTVVLHYTSVAGCRDSVFLPSFIRIVPPRAHVSITPKSGCAPLNVLGIDSSFTDVNEPIVSWSWNFGDTSKVGSPSNMVTGDSAKHTYPSTGVYNPICTITNSYGCKSTDASNQIIITPKPLVGFYATANYPRTVCGLKNIDFTDTTHGATAWLWNFGDGNTATVPKPKHAYADTGFFNVSLTVYNQGCADSLVQLKYEYVKASVPQFTAFPLSCNNPFRQYFENQSKEPIGNTDSFYWNFGDSTAVDSTDHNPWHTYKNQGVYKAWLRINNSKTFCDDSVIVPVVVKKVNANFTIKEHIGCPPFAPLLLASDSSQTTLNYGLYNWTFWSNNETETTSGVSAQAVLNNPGFFSIKLVVTDSGGTCLDSVTKTDSIHVLSMYPRFNIVSQKGCDTLHLLVLDSSYANSPITAYLWNFGDSTTLPGLPRGVAKDTALHNYTKPGYYNVRLTTTDADGTCTSPPIKIRYILPTPNDTILSISNCPGETVTFGNRSSFANKVIWDFGDGSPISNDSMPTHTFYTTKVDTVYLTAIDTVAGCMLKRPFPIKLDIQGPRIAFRAITPMNSCSPYPVLFKDSTWSPTPIISRYWDFGDGNFAKLPGNDTLTTNIYLQGGNYNVKVIEKNAGGCTDTLLVKDAVQVSGPSGSITQVPNAAVCAPLPVSFNIQINNAPSYTLLYGDGNSVSGTSSGEVKYTYNSATSQTFTPVLILTDPLGQCNTQIPLVNPINMYVAPKANFTFTPNIATIGQQVVFTDESGQADAWSWVSGDSGSTVFSTNSTADYVYKKGGTYTAALTVSYKGCTSSIEYPITVVENVVLPNFFTPNGDGKNDEWVVDATGMTNIQVYVFDRWGREVYSSTDSKSAWDGKFNGGGNVPEGVYFYTFTATSPASGKTTSQKGFIELLR